SSDLMYNGMQVNMLDTPGHKDFAEDTYRTLTAVDSVILVIDSVKGVEEQTERLMEVCRMRKTPVIIFVNKMDRDGKDAFDLLDELEAKLNIRTRPLSWPIGIGPTFQGVYNIFNNQLRLFAPNKTKVEADTVDIEDLNDPHLAKIIGDDPDDTLREDLEMVEAIYEPFERETYLNAEIAPVFFGSALNNFGIKELLETFIDIAPVPQPRETDVRIVEPLEKTFSGFVFKIHANLDPKHRDRIAFLRVCSGKFERNQFFYHVRLDKK